MPWDLRPELLSISLALPVSLWCMRGPRAQSAGAAPKTRRKGQRQESPACSTAQPSGRAVGLLPALPWARPVWSPAPPPTLADARLGLERGPLLWTACPHVEWLLWPGQLSGEQWQDFCSESC